MEDHIETPEIPDSNKAFFHIALANAKEKASAEAPKV